MFKISESDKRINDFLHIHENRRDYECTKYLNDSIYEKLYNNRVREIEGNELKYKFIIVCVFLNKKIMYGTSIHKLK